ncbi:MAG: Gfo/Idh/MocA family oxidoreductase [bacterium]
MSVSPGDPGTLTVGVTGVGHLGTYHLQKYAVHPRVGRILVYDIREEQAAQRAESVPSPRPVQAAGSPAALFEACDAVSVAVPTRAHREVTEQALAAGCHVLVEKPIAADSDEARALVEAAERADRVLQVGHVERFNPALQGLEAEGIVPGFIEAHRLAPYNPRGTDVPVVLDLMVHDLDLILHLVGEEPSELHAAGVAVITPSADIANVRLSFPGGCVANVTASRVSLTAMRKLRVFQRDTYLGLDLQQGRREIVRLRDRDQGLGEGELPVMGLEGRRVTRVEVQGGEDALAMEIDAFLRAVEAHRAGGEPKVPRGVSGREAARALALAEEITRAITA